MIRRVLAILVCVFFTISLYGNPLPIRITSDSDPQSTVASCVNALSGEFFYIENDIESKRAGGLNYSRVYDSGSVLPNVMGYGWGNNFPKDLIYFERNDKTGIAMAGNCEYDLFPFATKEEATGKFVGTAHDEIFKLGYINSAEANILGIPSFSRTIISCNDPDKKKKTGNWEVKLPDGTIRLYQKRNGEDKYSDGKLYRYRLTQEYLPNGHVRYYSYLSDSNSFEKIRVTNSDGTRELDSLTFKYGQKDKKYEREIHSAAGEVVRYKVKPTGLDDGFPGMVVFDLSEVTGSHLGKSEYKTAYYHAQQGYDIKIFKVAKPSCRWLYLTYNNDVKKNFYGKVKAVEVVLSPNGKSVPVYTFKYSKDQTEVSDPFNNKTIYNRVDRRLGKITQGEYRAFKYLWDSNGNLLSKGLQTIAGQTIRCTSFKYDAIGNLVEQVVSGNITGFGPGTFSLDNKGFPIENVDQAIHKYVYSVDGMNLRTRELLPNGACHEFYYKPKTNLLTKKLTTFNGVVQQREFNTYDENSLLVKTVVDDGSEKFDTLEGVSYRLITEIEPELNKSAYGYTQPKVIKESYLDLDTGEQKLLKWTEHIYNSAELVSEKRIYDSNGEYKYSLYFEYNAHHKVIQEINAHGEKTLYDYDVNDNLIYQEVVGSHKQSFFKYDLLNRLVEETEKHDDGVILTKVHKYDLLGNRLSSTDPYGGVTNYTYDAYGREISQTDPLGNTTFTEYDLLDNPVKITDKEGYTTIKKYTVDGKPYEIQYPDGTQEAFVYYPDGNLQKKWNKDGTQVAYTYDYLDRVTCENYIMQNGSLDKQEHYEYKGKNLVRHTDAMGVDTHYIYDCAGRLRAKVRDGLEEVYSYDSLGRLCKTIKEGRVEIKEYDFLDRVIEERVEDQCGNIYRKETSHFDVVGNRIRNRIYIDENTFSETYTIFNGQNLPVLVTDPEGYETQYFYTHNSHFEKKVIDSLGKQTREIYNLLDQIVSREVTHSSQLLAKEYYDYSPNGHKIRQVNYIIESGEVLGESQVEWTYDPMGNILSLVEQGTKVTIYTYQYGRLHSTTKPNGVVVTQKYDSLGRISSILSSDSTILHTYKYDICDNLVEAVDLNTNKKIERCYDSHHRIIHEKQATGIEFDFTYDAHDRLGEISWQDNKITYKYSPSTLVSASRYKKGRELYRYEQSVDWRGKIITSTLPNSTKIDYTWDKIGRCSSIDSKYFHQDLIYDSVGNLIATTLNNDHTTFEYDHLYQLTVESGQFVNQYIFDSLNNRRSKNEIPQDINELNQLLSETDHIYQYDLNGNRASKGDTHYAYDALGRLTSIFEGNSLITYRYDPLGRCYEKSDLDTSIQYIYQFDTEIGALENGKTKELRVIHGQFSSFAIELENGFFFPIRNHRGDTSILLDLQGKPVSSYHYDAFGEFIHEGSTASPWLFSGQRYDSATGLYTYAKRIYDPSIGRWLTPDPVGFADGPNLYAYVHNNPLIYVDPYGLWGENLGNWYNNSKQFSSAFTRGAVDDTTFGASSYLFGQHDTSSFAAQSGYYTGTACSMAAGLFYGSTWLKGGKAAINGYKYARSAYITTKTTKNVLEARKVVKIAQESKPLFKKIALSVDNKFVIPSNTLNGDWVKLSGMLRTASKGKGNFGIGSGTSEQALVMGKAWLGGSYKISSSGKAWVSMDGMRQFRLPSYKPYLNRIQANFESRFEGQLTKKWQSNAHLDIFE